MAIQIEKSLFMTKTDAMDTLSLIKLVSHGNFVEDTQERREQVFNQQNEDMMRSKNLNKMMKYPPVLLPLMRQSKSPFLLHNKSEDEVSCFHFMDSNDTLFDSKMKRKWKPWTKWMFLAVQSKIKKQSMRMKQ
jgi:hypothetical protein